jgi:hypothetical protein
MRPEKFGGIVGLEPTMLVGTAEWALAGPRCRAVEAFAPAPYAGETTRSRNSPYVPIGTCLQN